MSKVSKKVVVGDLVTQNIKEKRNKRGELQFKVVRVTNKNEKKGVKFDTTNEFYKELLNKYEASAITIRGMPLDGGFVDMNGKERPVTLKNKNYYGEDLQYMDEDYYSSLPRDKRDKLLST